MNQQSNKLMNALMSSLLVPNVLLVVTSIRFQRVGPSCQLNHGHLQYLHGFVPANYIQNLPYLRTIQQRTASQLPGNKQTQHINPPDEQPFLSLLLQSNLDKQMDIFHSHSKQKTKQKIFDPAASTPMEEGSTHARMDTCQASQALEPRPARRTQSASNFILLRSCILRRILFSFFLSLLFLLALTLLLRRRIGMIPHPSHSLCFGR